MSAMYEEIYDAADDWELEAERQEEEERRQREEAEQALRAKEEKEKKRRLAADAVHQVPVDDAPELTGEARELLLRAQQEESDALAAASLLGGKVDRLADRVLTTQEDHRAFGHDVALRFAKFDGDELGRVAQTVFERLFKTIPTSKELRDLEPLLNMAKAAAKASTKVEKKGDKVVVGKKNALDLDTTDRGGAAEAQDDCGW